MYKCRGNCIGNRSRKICGYQWWNYSWIPLHITQYTSIPTSMGFAVIVFVVMRYGFDFLMHLFLGLNENVLKGLAWIFGITLTVDMVYNLYLMYKNGKGIVRWRIETRRKVEV